MGIDFGLHCGYSLSPIESGVWDMSKMRSGEGAGMRWIRFRSYVADALDSGVVAVAYEHVGFQQRSVAAAAIYHGLRAILEEECEKRHIPYMGVNVTTLKTFATGSAKAKKDQMVKQANFRWAQYLDRKITDDNEADARFVRQWWLANWGQGLLPERARPISLDKSILVPAAPPARKRLLMLQAKQAAAAQ